MTTLKKGVRRLALILALAPIVAATLAAPAHAYDRGRHYERHDRHWHRRGYYAPPPPVYYPQQPVSPGISLFFPIR